MRTTRAKVGAISLLPTAGLALLLTIILAVAMAVAARAAGPESVANAAARLFPAVVNISTTQKVEAAGQVPMPNLPENSPFKEFFDDFFEKQQRDGEQPQRKASSLGSGFVIDPAGIIVTNNHVIEGAEEIEAKFPDGLTLKATLLGKDTKTDLGGVSRLSLPSHCPYVASGIPTSSARRRLGDGDRQSLWPRRVR